MSVHFSSLKTEWETPSELVRSIEQALKCRFKYDAASTEQNKKTPKRLWNGVVQHWPDLTWCNPPYGREYTKIWIEKAINEACSSKRPRIAMLIPARTDTKAFQCLLNLGKYRTNSIGFLWLKGRVKFETNKVSENSAPFPSVVVFFNYGYEINNPDRFKELGVLR